MVFFISIVSHVIAKIYVKDELQMYFQNQTMIYKEKDWIELTH
jgi:hypothetical protein